VATENLTKEKQAIIVTEIPYQVNKSKLIERIAELVNEQDRRRHQRRARRKRSRRHAHRHRAQARRAA
jgi:DNA gyrase/topoisomerase IV subunit A